MKLEERLPRPGSLWRFKEPVCYLRDKGMKGLPLRLKNDDLITILEARFDEKLVGYGADTSNCDYGSANTRPPNDIYSYAFDMSIVINAWPERFEVIWQTPDSSEFSQQAWDNMSRYSALYGLLRAWYKHFEKINDSHVLR